MKAFNKRLNHRTEVKAVDFIKETVKLVLPGSDPIFIYEELLKNVDLQEFTGVTLQKKDIYVGDKVTNGSKEVVVSKIPGGYFPFVVPMNVNFKKVENELQ